MARAVVIGGGPAGMMAADAMAREGVRVTLVDQMATLGRKFLMAGRGGLNLTHRDPAELFLARYGAAQARLTPIVEAFPPAALVAFAHELGQETFVGTSGRVFPTAMKASPMLRAWLARLGELGVETRTRTRFLDFGEGGVRCEGPLGEETLAADVVVLAMGGASWPRLGSNARWVGALERAGAAIEPFQPANAGALIEWSAQTLARAGEPVKRVALRVEGQEALARGDMTITRRGLEGGPIYALSAPLRAALAQGSTRLIVDLRPDVTETALAAKLAGRRKGDSTANMLRKAGALGAGAVTLLREAGPIPADPWELAQRIKATTLRVAGVAGLERAISSAGGVRFDEVDDDLMLKRRPGVYLAGEMLDWEAPTGGYLLQACFSTGFVAGRAAAKRALGG
jgi:hypothetical protein